MRLQATGAQRELGKQLAAKGQAFEQVEFHMDTPRQLQKCETKRKVFIDNAFQIAL